MAIAAVTHIFVYPATPYERNQFKEQNTNLIGIMADDVEEDIEAAATSLKESVQDVVFGGAGHVRIWSFLIEICVFLINIY